MTTLPTLLKTGTYNVANGDSGYSIRIGGGNLWELTYGAASGYDDGHYTWVTNLDTGSAKRITLNSGSGFEQSILLWPHQKIFIEKTIDKWSWFKPPRYKLWDSSIVLNVDCVHGSDSNDGISAPLQTIGYALNNLICDQLDLYFSAAPQITIQLADAVGSLYTGIHFPGCPVGKSGNASILIQGNSSDPTKTQIGPYGGGAGPLAMFDNSLLQLKNLMITPQGGTGISMDSGSQCWLMGGVIFGDSGSTGADMMIRDNSMLFVSGNYSKTGDMGYHVITGGGGKFLPKGAYTMSFSSNCTYNTFAYAQNQSEQDWSNMTINTNSHTMTGRKWYMDTLALIQTGGTARDTKFPGNTNGSSGPGNPQGDY